MTFILATDPMMPIDPPSKTPDCEYCMSLCGIYKELRASAISYSPPSR